MREHQVTANGCRFHLLEDGPQDGPLALLLHGFPDSAHSWRHLMPLLAAAGFRAVAPFLRGYAPTEAPLDGPAGAAVLADDAAALHAALGGDARAVIIGHDWGAAAATISLGRPGNPWRRGVTAAVPWRWAGQGLTSRAQLKRSWYMFFFQTALADGVLPRDDFALVDWLWQDWSPGFEAPEDIAQAKAALRGAANGKLALACYRAMFSAPPAPRPPPLKPLLYMQGTRDGCIGAEIVPPDHADLPAGSAVRFLEGAGHFLHLEQPGAFNKAALEFLAA